MLYVTTRNNQDAFTVQHAMSRNRGDDGGLYLPLYFPKLSADDLKKLRELSFNQRIASMLNLFFQTKLSGWDVDFSVGRYPVRLKDLSHRIIVGECWHNFQWRYTYLQEKLTELVCCEAKEEASWNSVAIRMAILAAVLLEREETESDRMDIAAAIDDFSIPISAWYLSKMGFPVGNIICCSGENNQLWELLCLGQMKVEAALPANFERLVSDCGGTEEVKRFISNCSDGWLYEPSEQALKLLRKYLFVSVVSDDRIETAIPNVFKTYDYVLQSDSALAYCGLMDYRTKTGITRPVVVIEDYSPADEADKISGWMGMPKEDFLRMI